MQIGSVRFDVIHCGKCVSQYANRFCQVWRYPMRFPIRKKIQLGLTSSTAGNAFPNMQIGSVRFEVTLQKNHVSNRCIVLHRFLQEPTAPDFFDDFYLPHESFNWHSTITESWIFLSRVMKLKNYNTVRQEPITGNGLLRAVNSISSWTDLYISFVEKILASFNNFPCLALNNVVFFV